VFFHEAPELRLLPLVFDMRFADVRLVHGGHFGLASVGMEVLSRCVRSTVDFDLSIKKIQHAKTIATKIPDGRATR
jgi:hypothetical protein